MGALLGLVYLGYIFFVIVWVVSVVKKTKKIRYGFVTLVIGIGIPTYDMVITNVLGAYYCYSEPKPKTFIKKTVEYPESIYWEDNIYPGFDEADRKLVVKNYLNGIYLKKIALNGRDDGKVYVYHYKNISREYFKKTEECKNMKNEIDSIPKHTETKASMIKEYWDKGCNELTTFLDNAHLIEQVYEKSNMPQMNYTVVSNEVKLSEFASKYLYSDEISVIENQTGEVIGYNKRYMHFFYNLFPDINVGNRYYDPYEAVCGKTYDVDSYVFDFAKINDDGKAAITNKVRGSWKHLQTIDNRLYEKYKKGE